MKHLPTTDKDYLLKPVFQKICNLINSTSS